LYLFGLLRLPQLAAQKAPDMATPMGVLPLPGAIDNPFGYHTQTTNTRSGPNGDRYAKD
jgi:hypothetical protein